MPAPRPSGALIMSNETHKKYATGFEGKRWIFHGLIWGCMMFILMGIVFRLAERETITLKSAAIDLVLWLIAGLAYGLTMKGYFSWQAKRKAARENQSDRVS